MSRLFMYKVVAPCHCYDDYDAFIVLAESPEHAVTFVHFFISQNYSMDNNFEGASVIFLGKPTKEIIHRCRYITADLSISRYTGHKHLPEILLASFNAG